MKQKDFYLVWEKKAEEKRIGDPARDKNKPKEKKKK
jgi:hypothetical protein